MQKIENLNNRLNLEQINLDREVIQMETAQKMAIIEAEKKQNVKVIEAEGIRAQAKARAEKLAEEIVCIAKAYAMAKKIDTDNNAKMQSLKANNRLEVA